MTEHRACERDDYQWHGRLARASDIPVLQVRGLTRIPAKWLTIAIAAVTLIAMTGCGRDHDHPTLEEIRTGPSGGVMLTTRNDAVNVEYIHQPAENKIILNLLDQQLQPVPGVQTPPTISIVANGEARQLDMTPVADRPASFEATDPSFAGEDFIARATIEALGETHQVELIEPDHHHHHH